MGKNTQSFLVKRCFYVLLFTVFVFPGEFQAQPKKGPPTQMKGPITQSLNSTGSFHPPFIKNLGQMDRSAAFYLQTLQGTVFVTKKGKVVYTFVRKYTDKSWNILSLKEELVGADPCVPKGNNPAETRITVFSGKNPANWKNNIPTFKHLELGCPYPKVSLSLETHGNTVEKVFRILPGGSPDVIRIELDGAKSLHINHLGELVIDTEIGKVHFSAPFAYQENKGCKESVPVEYWVEKKEYGFKVGNYDTSRALVIDPILSSTFLGGSRVDGAGAGTKIAQDAKGNIYAVGSTLSMNFPTTSGAYKAEKNFSPSDIFISKFDSSLSKLLASTYLGGANSEGSYPGPSITLDKTGNVYVISHTLSTDFPTTPGAYQTVKKGEEDVFICCLDPELSTLLHSTYLGGDGQEHGRSIALDNNGHVFISGDTASLNFPSSPGAWDTTHNGYIDMFVASMDVSLNTLHAATFLGGGAIDYSTAMAIHKNNSIYICGYTESSNFPTTSGTFDDSFNGGVYDATLSKFSADLTTLSASTFLGGNNMDFCYALVVDDSDRVYVSGHTASNNFPVTSGVYDETYNGVGYQDHDDVFIARFDNDIKILQKSTFLGGSGWEIGNSFALDGYGHIFVAGNTESTNFPVTPGAYDAQFSGGSLYTGDVFISRIDADLKDLSASTYLGGINSDNLGAILLDQIGDIYVSGGTSSQGFPTTSQSYDPIYNGGLDDWGGDAFITKMNPLLTAEWPPVDLVNRKVRMNPKSITRGDDIVLVARVKNNSKVESMPASLNFYLSRKGKLKKRDQMIGQASVGLLSPGKSKTFKVKLHFDKNLNPRTYYLISIVDRENRNHDIEKSNNIAVFKRKITVR